MSDKQMRYALQRTAQSLLFDREAEKQHRVCNCCRSTNGNGVDIFRTKDGKNARFGNLVKCGSVWHCAVCSGVVTEERRGEVQAGMNAWAKTGGMAYLMTLTFPHSAEQRLDDVLPKYAKAEQTFKNSKAYKAAKASHEWAGTIRGLEVTFGKNGWHPHTHVMIFAAALAGDFGPIADYAAPVKTPAEIAAARKAEIISQLSALDAKSIRPLREGDAVRAATLDVQSAALRAELATL